MVASQQVPRLCAVLTCFNRRELTLACLAALEVNQALAEVELHAVLVDDGSNDGTAAAVRQRFPWVEVVQAEGDLYWCRGMHRAFEQAVSQDHDFYLWLNDDTILDGDALKRILDCQANLQRAQRAALIVVGSTRDSRSGLTTYGGKRHRGWWPTRFSKVIPDGQAQRIDTFDGNIVLLSRQAVVHAGNLDAHFEHAMGDIDYGLRAGQSGVSIWLAPGWYGVCNDNPVNGTYLDAGVPWTRRWALMRSRKGLPLRSWLHFNRQHCGPLWPATFAWPYLRLALDGLRGWHRRKAA